jgi:hypothetical protein
LSDAEERNSRPAKAANPTDENRSQYNALDPIYEARLTGWLEGFHQRDAEVAHLNWTADRLYFSMCSRSPKPYVDRPSYASLERIRGNEANADKIDADNARRFAEVSA